MPNEAIKQIPGVPLRAFVTLCPYVLCFSEANRPGCVRANTCALSGGSLKQAHRIIISLAKLLHHFFNSDAQGIH